MSFHKSFPVNISATQISVSGGVNGILFDYRIPIAGSGAYTLSKNSAQIIDSNITGADKSTNVTKTTDGYARITATFTLWNLTGIAAKTTGTRLYRWNTRVANNGLAIGDSMICVFNEQDANNRYELIMDWTGSIWRLFLYSRISGSPVNRGSVQFTSAVAQPALVHVFAYDIGDTIIFGMFGFETDATVDNEARITSYTLASRPLKTQVGFGWGSWAGDKCELRRMTVEDI